MLSRDLFGEKQDKPIKKLWKDEKTKKFMIKEASKEMLKSPDLLPAHPFEQIQALMYDNSFASDEESIYVAGIIKKLIQDPKEIFPYITEQTGIELAEKCLISCGFFKKQMQAKSKRQQYPPPKFYENIGKEIFKRNKVYNLGNNFNLWTDKLQTFSA